MKQIDGYKVYTSICLGKGSFGAVYKGVSDKTGQQVAVKVLPKASIDADKYLKDALFSQIKIMQSIKSENIVGFLDVMESSKNYYIVQQLCDKDLSSQMKGGNLINQAKAKEYLRQICNGFLTLVREGIIHRDLKPANVMIRGDKLKIGDFGFAKKTQAASKIKNQTIVGTPLYMSIQILKSQPYSSKCDIWALGFIYYQMLHGYPPWNGKSQYDLIQKIQSKPLQIKDSLTPQSKDFLKKCLQIRQDKRMSWDQLFVHPIFKGFFTNNSNGTQQFENKLKMIMSDIRFQINSNNLDICSILANLGYKNGQNQLDKERFLKFLRIIQPDITKEASDYIFVKTDYDKNGTISINQIQKILNQNNISINRAQHQIPAFKKDEQTQSFQKISKESQMKLKGVFKKLYNQIRRKNSSLKQVFIQFDKAKKNSLDLQSFIKLMKSISTQLTNDEIQGAFDLIDEDGSKSIEYQQLQNYYLKVNGIPSANLNASNKVQKMQEQPPTPNTNQFNNGYVGGYNNNAYGNNGMMNMYGGYGNQPPMYNAPPPYNPFMQMPGFGQPPPYTPYQQPPPPPNGQSGTAEGLFGNYIFNQIQMAGKKQNFGFF